jgi:hypothetical protein
LELLYPGRGYFACNCDEDEDEAVVDVVIQKKQTEEAVTYGLPANVSTLMSAFETAQAAPLLWL